MVPTCKYFHFVSMILFQQILGNVVDSIRSVFPFSKSAAEVSNAVSLTAAEKSRKVANLFVSYVAYQEIRFNVYFSSAHSQIHIWTKGEGVRRFNTHVTGEEADICKYHFFKISEEKFTWGLGSLATKIPL